MAAAPAMRGGQTRCGTCWNCREKGHHQNECLKERRGSTNVVEPYLEECDGTWAVAELSNSEDYFLDLWTRPDISFNDGGDVNSPVYHFHHAVWLSNNEDEADEALGWIFELAVDWFAFDMPLGKPCVEKAWFPVDLELHNTMRVVARGAVNIVSQWTNIMEHKATQDLPMDEPLLTMSADIVMSPDIVHAALGPDQLLSMGKVSLDMAHGVLDCFEMDQVKVEGIMDQQEMRNEQAESLTHSKGESNGEVVDGMCMTPASACSQHDKLKDELTHLVYPLHNF